jgi:hypothetical protein
MGIVLNVFFLVAISSLLRGSASKLIRPIPLAICLSWSSQAIPRPGNCLQAGGINLLERFRPPALAGHRSTAVQWVTFMTPGGWLVAVSPGMWTSLRRQQWGPQVHFMGIVVKTPSKISRSFKISGPPVLRAVLPAQNEFRSSMKQSGERAVEGTPTQSSSVKTASVDLARLPSFVMSKLKRSPDF